MRNDTPRQIVRSRTTMSYAFEAAVRSRCASPAPISDVCAELMRSIADQIGRATRKTPVWTVSKKERRR